MARIDGERGHHREDQPVEDLVEIGAVGLVQRLPVAELDPLGPEGRDQLVQQQRLLAADHPLQRVADVGSSLSGVLPLRARLLMPATTWRRRPATWTWKNSSIRSLNRTRNLTRSSSGHVAVGHQIEQPVVEVEVRELAGEVAGIGVVPELVVQPPHGLDAH